MDRLDGSHTLATSRLDRERGRGGEQPRLQRREPLPAGAERYLQACRDCEASRLMLAALGRRRGPLD
jgi:hypothetical protein